MPLEHDHDNDGAKPAVDEAMGDAQAAQPAGSDGPEDGAFDGPSGSAPPPRPALAERPQAHAAQTAETWSAGELRP